MLLISVGWQMFCHLGSCQNYGPFLGTLNIRCRIIIRTQKGTLFLTTTDLDPEPPTLNPKSENFEVSNSNPRDLRRGPADGA